MQRSTQLFNKTDWFFFGRISTVEMSLEAGIKTKLNAWLAIRQRADLLKANISANKINLPQGFSYTEREYYDGSGANRQSSGAGSVVSYLDGRSDYYHYYYYYYYYYYCCCCYLLRGRTDI